MEYSPFAIEAENPALPLLFLEDPKWCQDNFSNEVLWLTGRAELKTLRRKDPF